MTDDRAPHERAGTAYDPDAHGHELQGRDKAPPPPVPHDKHGQPLQVVQVRRRPKDK